MKYYIIAGEASGDLHASNLMGALKINDPLAEFRCWGGDRMSNQGGTLVKHYKDLAFMGFLEVALNLRTILGNIDYCKKDILAWNPDAIVLVDYPGFNLRIAEFAHTKGYKVIYYISPQVWAWKKSRVHTIKKVVDKMCVILPFEQEFYKKYHYHVDYVGHPLLDAIKADSLHVTNAEKEEFITENKLLHKPIIAILPGSRKQEISKILPEMLKAWKFFKLEYQWVIAGIHTIDPSVYQEAIRDLPIRVIYGQTYNLLRNSYAAVVTSGTASLETAIFNIPQIICYKGSPISYTIARKIVDIKYIGLPNLILDKPVVKELIQKDLNQETLIGALHDILYDSEVRERIFNDYGLLREILGGGGASDRVANIIQSFITK